MRTPRSRSAAAVAGALAAALAGGGCTGESRPVKPGAATQGVEVRVSTTTPRVRIGGTATFTATVTGTADERVAWSVVEATGGSIDDAGRYRAPAAQGTFHVRARSLADERAFDVAPISVEPDVAVTISPSPAAVDACQALQLTGTALHTLSNDALRWEVLEGASGGAVSASGRYTAPATRGTYHVVATSVEDPARSATVAVTVSERIVSVAVSPPAASMQPGETRRFTATVTTTCGSFAAMSTLTAPGP